MLASLARRAVAAPTRWRPPARAKGPLALAGPRRFLMDEVQQQQFLANKIRRFKPTTPGVRHLVLVDRSELWKGKPIRALTRGLRKTGGRGHGGKISVRRRGGGAKRRYRFVDFKRAVHDTPAVVQRLEYDPNRNAHIALVAYADGRISYLIAPMGIEPGDALMASRTADVDIRIGNAMPLRAMPVGTVIHNVELTPGKGGQLARAAGTSCQLIEKETAVPGYALVRLQSKEQRLLSLECMATIGSVSNPLHKIIKLGKAGRSRWMGKRPKVRGVAMNPVDHPMGGGEGKSSGGRPSCSPTGLLSKGFKTRKKRKLSSKWIMVPRGGLRRHV